MKFIFTSDLHLTDAPQEEYRWGVFPFLHELLEDIEEEAYLFILGDLTDKKDKHSAKLVNDVVEHLVALELEAHVVLISGNHDYVDPKCPYFKFLSGFYHEPTIYRILDAPDVALIPHTRENKEFSEAVQDAKKDNIDYVLCHQTFNGSVASNGFKMEGLKSRWGIPIISGDIHVPQTVGDVTYCGSPHPVRFGDSFQPRVLVMDSEDRELLSVDVPTIRRDVITLSAEEIRDTVLWRGPWAELRKGDHVKVRIQLPRSEFGSWPEYRSGVEEAAQQMDLKVFGIELVEQVVKKQAPKKKRTDKVGRRTPVQVVESFAKERDLPEGVAEIGVELCDD